MFSLQNQQLQDAMARGAGGDGEQGSELPYGHGDPYRELWEVWPALVCVMGWMQIVKAASHPLTTQACEGLHSQQGFRVLSVMFSDGWCEGGAHSGRLQASRISCFFLQST